LASELHAAVPRKKKMQAKRKTTTTTPKPLQIFNELGKGLMTLFNPVLWFQQPQRSTESPENVIVDQPLTFNLLDSKTGKSAAYTTGDAKVDATITSFFGAMTQIFDNMFKTFVTPTMNGTIWDDTPRPNSSGGLANFLSSFFCQIFVGLLSPNYNGKSCFVYRYPNTTTTKAPTGPTGPTKSTTPDYYSEYNYPNNY
jgi:hypothetical protein